MPAHSGRAAKWRPIALFRKEAFIFNTYFSVLFNLLAAALIGLILYNLYREPSHFSGPTVAVVATALCLFAANLDRVVSIKASLSGFEATTREAKIVIDQAKATVKSLRELAVATASFQVDMLAAAGRFAGGGTIARKDAQKSHLLERLKELGLTDEQLAEVDRADREWVMIDYAFALLQPLNVGNDPEKQKAYGEAFSATHPLTPDECKNLLDRFGIDDQTILDLLEDYRYYFKTGKQRRPDVWKSRQ